MIHYCPMTQQDSLFPNEEYVQHDVKSLFSNVPIQETIDYVLGEIYVKNKLPKISSKFIFKRLLLKLTTENTFIFRKKLTVAGGPLLLYFQICMYISIKYVIKSLSNFYIYIYIYIYIYLYIYRRYSSKQDIVMVSYCWICWQVCTLLTSVSTSVYYFSSFI